MPDSPGKLTQLTLQTDRMIIRPFTEADMTPRYLGWLNDSIGLRYSQQRLQEQDLASCRAYRNSIIASGGSMLAVCVKREPTNVHIGNLTLRPFRQANTQIDISILIGERSEWGHGYATEAWLAICMYLFETHGTQRVTAGTRQDNKEMRALMARTGMQPFDPQGDRSRENVYMALERAHLEDGLVTRRPN